MRSTNPGPAGAYRSLRGLTAGKGNEIFRNEARSAGRGDERAPRGSDRSYAVHGRINMTKRPFASVIRHWPLSGQPVFCLLYGIDFLDVAIWRHDKGQGFPPVDFYQVNSFREKRTGTFAICERFRETSGSGLRRSHPWRQGAWAQASVRFVADSRPLRSRSMSNETA